MNPRFARELSLAVIVIVLATCLAAVPATRSQTSSQVRSQIAQAYTAVLGAEQSGGNVTSLVAKLDSALALAQEADQLNATNPSRAQSLYTQASTLAQQVISSAPAVASAGSAAVAASQLDLAIETAVLAALAVVAYVYTPRVFWRVWLRTHKDWRVKKR